MKQKYTIFWVNFERAKTGEVYYITTSYDRAVELFYKNYSNDYEILRVCFDKEGKQIN